MPGALTRQSRGRYHWTKALTVLFSAVIVILLPYAINQLFCWIAYPAGQVKTYLSGNVYNSSLAQELLYMPTPGLYMNNPFLLNCMHIGYACLYGGGIALMGYSLSLFIYKNKAVTNLLPIAIPLIGTFVGMYAFGVNFAPALAIQAAPIYTITSLVPDLIIIGGVYLIGIAGILLRAYIIKDEI